MAENEKPVSPLPWSVDESFANTNTVFVGSEAERWPHADEDKAANGVTVASFVANFGEKLANARYAVTACNAYPDLKARIVALETENARLREALEKIVAPSSSSNPRWWRKIADTALKETQG